MTTPNFPPVRMVIDIPLEGEPVIVDDGGLAPYLQAAVLSRALEQFETTWELSPAAEEDE